MKLPANLRNLVTKILTIYFRYVLIGLAVIILLIGYLVLLQPQIKNVTQDGVGALKQVEDLLGQRGSYLKRLQEMSKKYREVVAQQTTKPDDIIPTDPQVGKLFLMLDQLVQKAGFSLEGVAVTKGQALETSSATATPAPGTATKKTTTDQSTTTSTATIHVLDVNIAVSGKLDYTSYKRLLSTFERSLRLLDMPSINFQPSSPEDIISKTTGETHSFALKTYYLDPPSIK